MIPPLAGVNNEDMVRAIWKAFIQFSPVWRNSCCTTGSTWSPQ